MHIPSNKIIVAELKEMIFEKNRIHPSQQRLTIKIADTTFVNNYQIFNIIGNNDK